MGSILAGMASSHAFALVDPEQWDDMREANRRSFTRRYDVVPEPHPNIAREDDADIRDRYGRVEGALRQLGDVIARAKPSALVIVGDDQDENFAEECLPQLAIYITDSLDGTTEQRFREGQPLQAIPYHRKLAESILDHALDHGFDMAVAERVRHPRGIAHAFAPPLRFLDPSLRIPVVCVAINAIHFPAPSPARCIEIGKMLAQAIAATDENVVVYGSGGLSHFTAGFPYRALGRYCYGDIHVDFDARVLEALETCDEAYLRSLTSRDLLEHGDTELRAWLAVSGAMSGTPAKLLAYEPFFRGVMGMGCALWN